MMNIHFILSCMVGMATAGPRSFVPASGTGADPPETCCPSKRVGDINYTLVDEVEPTQDCLDGCIYIDNEDFTKSEHFCFGIGTHSNECLTIGYVPPTAPTSRRASASASAFVPSTTPDPACLCGKKGKLPSGKFRVVGGKDADKHEYPWQVGIVKPTGKTPYCGGTLLSPKHIITAAHCTDTQSASDLAVLIGEHITNDNEFNRVKVARIIQDPNYNKTSTDFDYAILELAEAVTFSEAARPACLPADLSETYEERYATVTGWGTLASGGNIPSILQEVAVTLTTKAKCEELYPGRVTPHMMCTLDVGKDSCQGDSGGPLILSENSRKALIGVVSWGDGCAAANMPGVYARVTERMDWILANTRGTHSSTCHALN